MSASSCVDGETVLGHGLDVVDINDFSKLLQAPARAFLDRYFTDNEMTAAGQGASRLDKLAGRFAIKEAVMKALGVGWGDGIAFTDVEVVTLEAGAPSVLLHRELAALQVTRGINRWLISSSHAGAVAVASVIAIGSAK